MSHLLDQGRECCRRGAWADAYAALTAADEAAPLEADDLEQLALAAYLLGNDDAYLAALDRAHHAHQAAGRRTRASRCAFWLGFRLALRGLAARANGWFARAERLLEGEPPDAVERGYLLIPEAERRIRAGELDSALATTTEAAAIGERCSDDDLVACARHVQGLLHLELGRLEEGLRLLDEVMLAVTSGELSPIVTGLIYCNVIERCRRLHAIERAREWTDALAEWCRGQPQMVAFTEKCLIHRAEILQFQGEWGEALAEARRACERSTRVAAAAWYQQGEVHRLRGELAEAEAAYRAASQHGSEPQPGLALLRLAQGQVDAAVAAVRRALSTTIDPLARARLLPGYVDIMVAAGSVEEAREACRELDELAARFGARLLTAAAAHARGAVALASGDAEAACRALRRAGELWRAIGAPYPEARSRELTGLACRAFGDEDGGALELQAARDTFSRLAAAPDLARIDSLAPETPDRSHPLTKRELQVLALVVTGKTNKQIAGELALSEKTIDRHLSNIFNKLGVSSRTAAAAYAYEHHLLG